ncbi:MAG: energy transducer TonB [Planctomycetes bacterium]|nr:energy transducer TonB [Planctomycetota bacterium]
MLVRPADADLSTVRVPSGIDFGGGERVRPTCPSRSRRLGEQGTVTVRVLVDEHDHPRQVDILRSSGHAALDDSARAAVLRWRFTQPGSGPASWRTRRDPWGILHQHLDPEDLHEREDGLALLVRRWLEHDELRLHRIGSERCFLGFHGHGPGWSLADCGPNPIASAHKLLSPLAPRSDRALDASGRPWLRWACLTRRMAISRDTGEPRRAPHRCPGMRHLLLLVVTSLALPAADYAFAMDGEPVQPEVIALTDGAIHPVAGDVVFLGSTPLVVGAPGAYVLRRDERRILLSEPGSAERIAAIRIGPSEDGTVIGADLLDLSPAERAGLRHTHHRRWRRAGWSRPLVLRQRPARRLVGGGDRGAAGRHRKPRSGRSPP